MSSILIQLVDDPFMDIEAGILSLNLKKKRSEKPGQREGHKDVSPLTTHKVDRSWPHEADPTHRRGLGGGRYLISRPPQDKSR
jgi:hypothetical protein